MLIWILRQYWTIYWFTYLNIDINNGCVCGGGGGVKAH